MNPVLKKILFFAVPLFFATLAYQTLFHPVVFEKILQTIVSKASRAELRATVKRSSLIYGFELTNIVLFLKSDELKSDAKKRSDLQSVRRPSKQRLLSIERLRLSWFLPGVLVGHIGLRELSLKSPHMYIERHGGLWNWQQAFPAKSRVPVSKKKEKFVLPHSLSFFTELRAYLNIKIEDAKIFIKDGSADSWSLEVSGLNLRLSVLTHPMRKIPLNAEAAGLLRTTLFALNPFSPIQIDYKGRQRLKGSLKLQMLLFGDSTGSIQNELGRREFALRLICDTQGLSFLNADGKVLGKTGLHLHLESSYDAEEDRLLLHRLDIGHGRENWLSAQGRLLGLSVPERELVFHISPSLISLARMNRLLAVLSNTEPGKSLLQGTIQIAGIEVSGRPDRLELKGGLHAREVAIAMGGGHRLKNLDLAWQGRLDLYRNFPARLRPTDYDAEKKLAFGVVDEFHIPLLKIHYNGMEFSGVAQINSRDGLKSKINIRNFDAKRYLPNRVEGKAHARLELFAPENFRLVDFQAKIDLLQARYFLGRSRSGYQNLHLAGSGRLNFSDIFSVSIKNLRIFANSLTGQRLITLRGDTRLTFGKAPSYQIELKQLQVRYPRLQKLLPGSLRAQLRPAELYLSKGIALKSNTNIYLSENNTKIFGESLFVLPYLRLRDLQIDYKLELGAQKILLHRFQIRGLKGALSAHLDGSLDKSLPQKNTQAIKKSEKQYSPNLHLKLRLAQNKYLQVHENINMQGLLDLELQVEGKKAQGRLKIEDLNLAYYTGSCQSRRSPDCKRWIMRGLNLDLPLEHNFEGKAFSVLSQNPARYYASSFDTNVSPNLSLQLVFASHNPQGKFQKDGFYYLGSPQSKAPGLVAHISYRRNVLLLKRLQMELYKLAKRGARKDWKSSGQIRGQDIYLNLADLEPRHMEANAMLQLKNLDLEPFLPESRSSYDGVISADLSLLLSSLKDPLYHTTARLAVYRISNEFSGFVTRIIMPAQVVAMLARNIIEIPAINLELKAGLVYSTIQVRRARIFPGILIAPGKNEIKQERMPLAEFLSRAKSEVQSIGSEEPKKHAN